MTIAEETQNYIVGTNSSPRNVAEALRQGIIRSEETLLGIFDGVFYDSDNKRIGGIALNDFLVITDQAVITWARDQQRDYVDRFPLSHVFLTGKNQKDPHYGVVRLALVLPNVTDEELGEAEQLQLTFDFVPLGDLDLAAALIEVMGNAHRDLIEGGAGEEDRYRAARVLFSQVFLTKFLGVGGSNQPSRPGQERGRTDGFNNESFGDYIGEDEADAFMTPLSRLDQLDSFNRREPASPYGKSFADFEPLASRQQPPPKRSYYDPYEAQAQAQPEPTRFYRPNALEQTQGHYSSSASGQASAIEQELRWLSQNGGQPGAKSNGHEYSNKSAPGARLRDELNNSEAFYMLGRAGRAMFDNLDKLRRDAESKSMGLVPFLGTLRDSGMNVRDLTEFLLAANDLLDTVGRNPAAREIAMMFANRALNDAGKIKPGSADAKTKPNQTASKPTRPLVEIEEADKEEAPRPAARVKVERRNKPKPAPEPEVDLNLDNDAAPSIPLGASQTTIPDIELEASEEVLDTSQTRQAEPEAISFAKTETEVVVPEDFPVVRPPKHRLSIRGNNSSVRSSAGAADGGGDEEVTGGNTTVNFSAQRGPDLN